MRTRRSRRRVAGSSEEVDAESSSEYTNEENIPKKMYDQPKYDEQYLDDCMYNEPYRHVTNWFLSMPGKEGSIRQPLPGFLSPFGNKVLYGELEPSTLEVEAAGKEGRVAPCSMKVAVSRLKGWTIDNSPTERGIWIITKNAYYKLKKPSDRRIRLADGTETSQEDVHLPMRAKFGLVSNIFDMLDERRGSGVNRTYYIKIHTVRIPADSHKLLSPPADMIEKYPDLNSEPFDLELLRREPTFVKSQLKGFDNTLTSKCNFMQGLSDMATELAQAKRGKEPWAIDEFDYGASAEAAEKRSRRMPWGCMVPGAAYVRPNMLIDIEVENTEKRGDFFVRDDENNVMHGQLRGEPTVEGDRKGGNESNDDNSKEKPSNKNQENVSKSAVVEGNSDEKGFEKIDDVSESDGEPRIGLQRSPTTIGSGGSMTPVDKKRSFPVDDSPHGRGKERCAILNGNGNTTMRSGRSTTTLVDKKQSSPVGDSPHGRARKRCSILDDNGNEKSGYENNDEVSDSDDEPLIRLRTSTKTTGDGRSKTPVDRKRSFPVDDSAQRKPKKHFREARVPQLEQRRGSSFLNQFTYQSIIRRDKFPTKALNVIEQPRSNLSEYSMNIAMRHIRKFVYTLSDGRRAVRDDKIDEFLEDIVTSQNVSSFEVMLACVQCLCNSSFSVLKKLFNRKDPANSGCRCIFMLWLDAANQMMVNRLASAKARSACKRRTEEEMVIAIMKLMRLCCGGKKQKPDDILEIFDIDVSACMEKTLEVSDAAKSNAVDSCLELKLFLHRLKKQANSEKKTSHGNNSFASRPTEEKDILGDLLKRRSTFSTNKLIRDGDQKKQRRQEFRLEKTRQLDMEDKIKALQGQNKLLRLAIASNGKGTEHSSKHSSLPCGSPSTTEQPFSLPANPQRATSLGSPKGHATLNRGHAEPDRGERGNIEPPPEKNPNSNAWRSSGWHVQPCPQHGTDHGTDQSRLVHAEGGPSQWGTTSKWGAPGASSTGWGSNNKAGRNTSWHWSTASSSKGPLETSRSHQDTLSNWSGSCSRSTNTSDGWGCSSAPKATPLWGSQSWEKESLPKTSQCGWRKRSNESIDIEQHTTSKGSAAWSCSSSGKKRRKLGSNVERTDDSASHDASSPVSKLSSTRGKMPEGEMPTIPRKRHLNRQDAPLYVCASSKTPSKHASSWGNNSGWKRSNGWGTAPNQPSSGTLPKPSGWGSVSSVDPSKSSASDSGWADSSGGTSSRRDKAGCWGSPKGDGRGGTSQGCSWGGGSSWSIEDKATGCGWGSASSSSGSKSHGKTRSNGWGTAPNQPSSGTLPKPSGWGSVLSVAPSPTSMSESAWGDSSGGTSSMKDKAGGWGSSKGDGRGRTEPAQESLSVTAQDNSWRNGSSCSTKDKATGCGWGSASYKKVGTASNQPSSGTLPKPSGWGSMSSVDPSKASASESGLADSSGGTSSMKDKAGGWGSSKGVGRSGTEPAQESLSVTAQGDSWSSGSSRSTKDKASGCGWGSASYKKVGTASNQPSSGTSPKPSGWGSVSSVDPSKKSVSESGLADSSGGTSSMKDKAGGWGSSKGVGCGGTEPAQESLSVTAQGNSWSSGTSCSTKDKASGCGSGSASSSLGLKSDETKSDGCGTASNQPSSGTSPKPGGWGSVSSVDHSQISASDLGLADSSGGTSSMKGKATSYGWGLNAEPTATSNPPASLASPEGALWSIEPSHDHAQTLVSEQSPTSKESSGTLSVKPVQTIMPEGVGHCMQLPIRTDAPIAEDNSTKEQKDDQCNLEEEEGEVLED